MSSTLRQRSLSMPTRATPTGSSPRTPRLRMPCMAWFGPTPADAVASAPSSSRVNMPVEMDESCTFIPVSSEQRTIPVLPQHDPNSPPCQQCFQLDMNVPPCSIGGGHLRRTSRASSSLPRRGIIVVRGHDDVRGSSGSGASASDDAPPSLPPRLQAGL
eukprot:m51a1_g9703 hypothetical protein (159) ;mRNA; f:1388368-1388844